MATRSPSADYAIDAIVLSNLSLHGAHFDTGTFAFGALHETKRRQYLHA